MMTYDLYGSSLTDISKAKEVLENALSVKFEERDSSYHGEYFAWNDECSEENLVLKRNRDPIDEGPAEISFVECSILFYVNDTLRSVELQGIMAQRVEDFTLLRHEEL